MKFTIAILALTNVFYGITATSTDADSAVESLPDNTNALSDNSPPIVDGGLFRRTLEMVKMADVQAKWSALQTAKKYVISCGHNLVSERQCGPGRHSTVATWQKSVVKRQAAYNELKNRKLAELTRKITVAERKLKECESSASKCGTNQTAGTRRARLQKLKSKRENLESQV
ncbi:MAG: hypothetical protein SGCHY_003873 [Lobulomycetales sp.]